MFGYAIYARGNDALGKTGKTKTPHLTPCEEDVCDYLILGNDSRRGLSKADQARFGNDKTVPGARSDTIMLVRVDPQEEHAVVLSFPRDLWVHIPGQGMGKITSAVEGGPDRVAHVITNLTGLPVNHFVTVNLAGFQHVVEALQGVPICVDRPMVDEKAGLDIPAGCQDLDPDQALAFVRARNVCGDNIPDFSRISRQQQFLRAVIAKILSAGMILRAQSLIDQVAPNLLVDADTNLADIIYLTHKLEGIGTSAVDFRSVPGDPYAFAHTEEGRVSIVKLLPEAKELFGRLRDREPLGDIGKVLPGTPPSPATIRVRVLDAGSSEAATVLANLLTKGGFDFQGTADAGSLAARGHGIFYAPGAKRDATVVRRFVPGLQLKPAQTSELNGVDVAVVVDSSVNPSAPGSRPPGAGCG